MTYLQKVAAKLGLQSNEEPQVAHKSVRTIAKEEGVNINQLLEILRRQRPAGSKMEQEFCDQYLLSIDGMNEDEYGNFWLQIGDETKTMFSCHTDTVAKTDGFQNIEWMGDVLGLHNGKPGQCLGADDGAGIWLMLEMIKAKKPGLYVFHREEEIGGLGSADIVKNRPQLVSGIERAIAFDRMDLDSVITHQRSKRCCSSTFAKALAAELNKTEGFDYKEDPTGSFTDTANYDGIIAECTNLSVGYYKQHGPKETLDVAHLYKLREAMLRIDFEALPTERDPTEEEYDSWGGYGGYGNYSYSGSSWPNWGTKKEETEEDKIEKIIRNRAYSLARIYVEKGWTSTEVNEMIEEYWDRQGWNNPITTVGSNSRQDEERGDEQGREVGVLECASCKAVSIMEESTCRDGDLCPECGSNDTYVEYELLDDAESVLG